MAVRLSERFLEILNEGGLLSEFDELSQLIADAALIEAKVRVKRKGHE